MKCKHSTHTKLHSKIWSNRKKWPTFLKMTRWNKFNAIERHSRNFRKKNRQLEDRLELPICLCHQLIEYSLDKKSVLLFIWFFFLEMTKKCTYRCFNYGIQEIADGTTIQSRNVSNPFLSSSYRNSFLSSHVVYKYSVSWMKNVRVLMMFTE